MLRKLPVLFSIVMLPLLCVKAQGIFNQNGEIIKQYILQLGLLQTYQSEIQEGYNIVEGGINLTHDLKNGEFGLHSAYYHSLLTVNDNIKKYPEVQQILDLYNKMSYVRTTIYGEAKSSGMFTSDELKYLDGIYTNLFKTAGKDLDELQQLITDGKLKLSDDERLARIDAVYKRMATKFKVLTGFNNRIILTINGRKAQQQHAEMLEKLYGL